jgi:hypothetical protein
MALSTRGREEMCVTHSDRPAAARCEACHKPVCAACVVSNAEGKFCSRECAARTAEFRTRTRKEESRGSGLAGVVRFIIWVVIIIVALCVVNRYVHKIPVIGDHLWKPAASTP